MMQCRSTTPGTLSFLITRASGKQRSSLAPHLTILSRTRSPESPLPEAVSGLEPGTRVTGGVIRQDLYHNGGEWLYGVFRTGQGQVRFDVVWISHDHVILLTLTLQRAETDWLCARRGPLLDSDRVHPWRRFLCSRARGLQVHLPR